MEKNTSHELVIEEGKLPSLSDQLEEGKVPSLPDQLAQFTYLAASVLLWRSAWNMWYCGLAFNQIYTYIKTSQVKS
jgi:hypothetical protein